MGFLTDMRVREEAGPYISSIGAGTVHLRVQMLFRVGVAVTRWDRQPGIQVSCFFAEVLSNILQPQVSLKRLMCADLFCNLTIT
jgi:B9 domain-containing protein 2